MINAKDSQDDDDFDNSKVEGYCPECGKWAKFEGGMEVGCEDCGSHPAVECSNCEERFDMVRQYDWIREYNEERYQELIVN